MYGVFVIEVVFNLGEIATVANTVFDLREGVMLGERIQKVPDDLGYDHNFCVEGDDFKKLAAR